MRIRGHQNVKANEIRLTPREKIEELNYTPSAYVNEGGLSLLYISPQGCVGECVAQTGDHRINKAFGQERRDFWTL